MSARFIGIDHGTKRIGLAVSDPLGSIASPLVTVEASGKPAEQVQRTIEAATEQFDIDEWVVGHAIHMDGTEGSQAQVCSRFAKLLEAATGDPVHLWDERLSSAQADTYLAEGNLTYKKRKARRDMLAAQIILQSFLDARAVDDSPPIGGELETDGPSL